MEQTKKLLIALLVLIATETACVAENTGKGLVPWVNNIQGDKHSLFIKHADADWNEATANTLISQGDMVWQENGGQSEIYLDQKTFIRLGRESGLEFKKLSDQQVEVALTKGKAEVGTSTGKTFLINVPGQSVVMKKGSDPEIK